MDSISPTRRGFDVFGVFKPQRNSQLLKCSWSQKKFKLPIGRLKAENSLPDWTNGPWSNHSGVPGCVLYVFRLSSPFPCPIRRRSASSFMAFHHGNFSDCSTRYYPERSGTLSWVLFDSVEFCWVLLSFVVLCWVLCWVLLCSVKLI